MKKAALAIAAVMVLLFSPKALHCGKVGGTLARYSMGGAGVGALLGAATATIPYLSSHQSFDFITGAGVGCLTGAGVGFIFGVIDLATFKEEAPAATEQGQGYQSQIFAFNTGTATYLGWKTVF